MRSFEEVEPIIDDLLERRRGRWSLEAVRHVDFDDIKQDIKLHVFTKFNLWDQSLPFENWCATLIHNQILNKKKSLWRNHEKPCSNCYFNCGGDNCKFTPSGLKNQECPEFRDWLKKKRTAYEIKKAIPIEAEDGEILHSGAVEIDYDKFLNRLNSVLSEKVRKGSMALVTYKIFKMSFLEKLDDEIVAEKMGYKSNESNRTPGYKILSSHKNRIKEVAKECLEREDYEFI